MFLICNYFFLFLKNFLWYINDKIPETRISNDIITESQKEKKPCFICSFSVQSVKIHKAKKDVVIKKLS